VGHFEKIKKNPKKSGTFWESGTFWGHALYPKYREYNIYDKVI